MKQAQVLNERDVKRVLAAITKRSYCSRDRAMFMLSYLAGMRVGEIAALRVSDVYEAYGGLVSSDALPRQFVQSHTALLLKGRVFRVVAEMRFIPNPKCDLRNVKRID